MIDDLNLTPIARLDVECSALQERLRDIAQERVLILADVEAGKPGARSQLVANIASEGAIRRMARELLGRVERHMATEAIS